MDFVAIAALALKGLTIIETAISTGNEAATAINAVKNILSKPADQITQADMDAADQVLDDQLASFNAPMPAKPGSQA